MKRLAVLVFVLTCGLNFNAYAENEPGEEGRYEVGSCSTAKARENAGSVFERAPVLFGGRKTQLGCCRATVAAACGQSFAEMAQSVAELRNSENWAVCMRGVAIARASNPNGTERLNTCHSESCQKWAEDCHPAGLSNIRKLIEEEYPQ